MMNRTLSAIVTAGLLFSTMAVAGDWPQWRGPNFDGSAAADEKNLPASFSTTENVAWATAMPGPSAATPIISGDKVFVSTFNPETSTVDAMCLDRRDGKVLWQKTLGPGEDSRRPGTENHLAEPSAVTDGEKVIFFTGNGDLVAFDLEGNETWRMNVQEKHGSFNILWGYAASPMLYNDKLYIAVMQRDVSPRGEHDETRESYLLCLNPNTGEEIFKHVRPNDARAESKESYGTPIPRVVDGRVEILVLAGDCITGHDADTGKELWRYGDWNPRKITHWRIVPSPTVGDGLVFASAPKGAPVFAVNVDGGETKTAWSFDEAPTDVGTPLYYEGNLYVLDGGKKIVTRINPQNGESVWSKRIDIPTYFRSSITAGDGKLYLINADGEAYVFSAEDGEMLHHASMGGYPARASIAISQGQLFIRTAEKLYCIGE